MLYQHHGSYGYCSAYTPTFPWQVLSVCHVIPQFPWLKSNLRFFSVASIQKSCPQSKNGYEKNCQSGINQNLQKKLVFTAKKLLLDIHPSDDPSRCLVPSRGPTSTIIGPSRFFEADLWAKPQTATSAARRSRRRPAGRGLGKIPWKLMRIPCEIWLWQSTWIWENQVWSLNLGSS